jgi:hypothetical protein
VRKLPLAALGVAASLVAAASAVPAGAASPPMPKLAFKVVATDLNNPRQLNFSKSGTLFIAEAGTGGSHNCTTGGEGSAVCQGPTGSVTEVANGHQRRVLTGLPSYADQGAGTTALGPADVVPYGQHRLAVSIGYGLDPAFRAKLARPGQLFGRLLSVDLGTHTIRTLGDLAAFEGTFNPIHDPNSDPTGVARWRKGWVATDSGGNDLVRVAHHKVSLVNVFPDVTTSAGKVQSVPTDVVVGPDGALYMSELTGAPFVKGVSKIYRIVPGHKPRVYASGLTNVTSLAFGPDGTLYAVQISNRGLLVGPTGSLWRVPSDRSGHHKKNVSGPLFAPYGVAIKGHSAYLSTGAVVPSGGPPGAPTGQVIQVPLP